MLFTGSRRMPHPAHELRQLGQLQPSLVVALFNQERPEGL
jgi:hypothetical protein